MVELAKATAAAVTEAAILVASSSYSIVQVGDSRVEVETTRWATIAAAVENSAFVVDAKEREPRWRDEASRRHY